MDALTTELRTQINRDLNQALQGVNVNSASDPLVKLQDDLRTKSIQLAQAEDGLTQAHQRVQAAEKDLFTTRQQFGAESQQARDAEARLSTAVLNEAAAEDKRNTVLREARTLWQDHSNAQNDSAKSTDNNDRVVRTLLGSLGSLRGILPNVTSLMGQSGRAGAGMAAIGLGAGAAAQLTTSLIPLVGWLIQASGAALAIPAAFAAFSLASITAKVGLSGMSDALKLLNSNTPLTTAQQKQLNAAIQNLAPNAQATVRSLAALHDQFDAVRRVVQTNLFFGVSAELDKLGKVIMPVLNTGMGQVSDALNGVIIKFLELARSTASMHSLATIFQNTASSIVLGTPGVIGFAAAMRDIATIGSQFLPQFALAFGKLGQNFADFTHSAQGAKEIQTWIAQGIEALKQLGQIARNLGGILSDLWKGAQVGAGGVGNVLVELTSQVRNFLDSIQGQKAAAQFFNSLREVAAAVTPVFLGLVQVVAQDLAPVLADIAKTIGPPVLSLVQNLGKAFDTARPAIDVAAQSLGVLINDLGPHLPAIATALFQLVDAGFHLLDAVSPLLGPVADLASALATALKPAADALKPVLQNVGDLLGNALVSAVQQLAPILPPLIGIIGIFADVFIKAVAPILPVVVDLLKAFATGLIALAPPILIVVASLEPFLGLLGALVAMMTGNFSSAASIMQNSMTSAGQIMGIAVNTDWSGMLTSIVNGTSGMVGATQSGWDGMNGLTVGGLANINGAIAGGVPGWSGQIGGAGQSMNNILGGAFAGMQVGAAAGTFGIGAAIGANSGQPIGQANLIGSGITQAINGIDWVSLGSNIVAGIASGMIRGIGSHLQGAISSIVGNVQGGIANALGINSPSRWMRDNIGLGIDEGIGAGITRYAHLTLDPLGALSDQIKTGALTPLSSISPSSIAGGDGASAGGLDLGALADAVAAGSEAGTKAGAAGMQVVLSRTAISSAVSDQQKEDSNRR